MSTTPTITLADLERIREPYKVLSKTARPENPSGQCTYREYLFSDAVKYPIYKRATMTNEEIVTFFGKITSDKHTHMTESDMWTFVQCALSLKDPVDRSSIFDKGFWDANHLCADYATAQPANTGKVAMSHHNPGVVVTQLVPSTDTGSSSSQETESMSSKAEAISFYFAWLTRFSVKQAPNTINVLYDRVRATYLKFYSTSSSIFDTFRPSNTWLQGLKDAFDTFPRVKNTLILHVAHAETYFRPTPKIFNVLRFLFFQNLEFMGLHAYVSIVTIMSKVALPPSQVLSWLRVSGSEMAIDEAFMIMNTLDNGMIDNGHNAERLWKYARCLDQGYFNRLQSSYSAELIAMLAYIEINMGISTEVGYNSPLNIYAIANNKAVKEVGRMKADVFIQCKNSVVSLTQDASVIDKVYAAAQQKHIRSEETARPAEQNKEDEVVAMDTDAPSRKRRSDALTTEKPRKALPAIIKLPNIPDF
nr:nucleocapsid protein [Sonchus yellow net nucleorhabdovirus]